MTRLRKTWIRRFSFNGLSIKQRLPLLICILLLLVMLTFTLISYIGVKRVSLTTGKERLSSLADQLSNMFSNSMQNMFNNVRTLSSQESTKRVIRNPNFQDTATLPATLDKMLADSQVMRIELLNLNHHPVFYRTKDSLERWISMDSMRQQVVLKDTIPVGKLFHANQSLFYPVIAPVMDNKAKLGHILIWRKLASTRQAVDMFSKLLGSHARFYIGNKDRSLWSDLMSSVDDPLPASKQYSPTAFNFRDANGTLMLATSRPIANTSWMLLLEFPRDNIMAPANQFLKWVIIIGSILVLLGIFIAWRLSNNITNPLDELTGAVTAIAGGQERTTVAVHRRDELGKLARAFNAMIKKVNTAKHELEQKIIETEVMNSQLRDLSAHLQNIREEERIHIAREMHDELGQLLTGFKMDVSWLHKKLSTTSEPAVKEKLEEMMEIVNEAAKFVRKLASELRPSILDDLGLIPALDWHSQEFKRRTHINIEFRTELQELQTTELIATGLFRMYQESLTNVARHANARNVHSKLELRNGELLLTITDDGRGFDLTGTGDRKTLGLLGMKERASMIGGKLSIRSSPGEGTTITITVPLHKTAPTEPVLS